MKKATSPETMMALIRILPQLTEEQIAYLTAIAEGILAGKGRR